MFAEKMNKIGQIEKQFNTPPPQHHFHITNCAAYKDVNTRYTSVAL